MSKETLSPTGHAKDSILALLAQHFGTNTPVPAAQVVSTPVVAPTTLEAK